MVDSKKNYKFDLGVKGLTNKTKSSEHKWKRFNFAICLKFAYYKNKQPICHWISRTFPILQYA